VRNFLAYRVVKVSIIQQQGVFDFSSLYLISSPYEAQLDMELYRAWMYIYFFIFSQWFLKCSSECDKTKSYNNWKDSLYQGPLQFDATFWRYQAQTFFKLTNFLALELAITSCTREFDSLKYYQAGRMGPVYIQDGYNIMCREECLEVDRLILEVLELTGCSCLELSTQPEDPAYHIKGDLCLRNTARVLCDKIGYCGIWNCRIDDFMCPRYEWNKKVIPFKGAGSCISSAFRLSCMHFTTMVLVAIVFVYNIFLS